MIASEGTFAGRLWRQKRDTLNHHMPGIYIWAMVLLMVVMAGHSNGQEITIRYARSYDEVINPERGFYTQTGTRASLPTPLSMDALDNIRERDRVSLIFRYIYLDSFMEGPVSESFLEEISNDFKAIRDAGFKVIVRFAYSSEYTGTGPFYDSPIKSVLLGHISQLKPLLRDNSDVILTLQNGFWGTWGENYASDEFGCFCDETVTEQNWLDRKQVTDSLLAVMPENRMVSLRYPVIKSGMYGFAIPADSLTKSEAYSGTLKSRLGYHNDCFLAEFNDLTFINTELEKPYWETESRYTIMGGETCADNEIYTNCSNAMTDLENASWTYLNNGFHPDVLERWRRDGCFEEIRDRLGYRLSLSEGTFDTLACAGSDFNCSISLYNEGFAAPVHERPVMLVFKNDRSTYTFDLSVDPRTWFGGTQHTISSALYLPSDMENGVYNIFLYMPDAAESLAGNSDYAIQLANEDIWDELSGYNRLNVRVRVVNIDNSVMRDGDELIAAEEDAEYQWLTCGQNLVPIAGETNRFFTSNDLQSYFALKITKHGCIDTSSCISMKVLGSANELQKTVYTIFPVPNHGDLNIDLGQVYERVSLIIYDTKGTILRSSEYTQTQWIHLDIAVPSGLYMGSIATETDQAIFKIIVK